MKSQPIDRQVTIRVPSDLHDRLRQLADQDERTVSSLVRRIVRRHLEAEDSASDPT